MELRAISPEHRKRVILAAESTCELCGEYLPVQCLELHRIPGSQKMGVANDPQRGLLVLCHPCHVLVHSLPLPRERQRVLVGKRDFYCRRDMRRILGYRQKPYRPPEETDWERLYNSVFELGSLVLNGT